MKKSLMIAMTCLFALTGVSRADSIIQLSLWPPIQLIDESQDITGLSFNIYGRNKEISGLAFGIAMKHADLGGVVIGLVAMAGQDAYGLHWCFTPMPGAICTAGRVASITTLAVTPRVCRPGLSI